MQATKLKNKFTINTISYYPILFTTMILGLCLLYFSIILNLTLTHLIIGGVGLSIIWILLFNLFKGKFVAEINNEKLKIYWTERAFISKKTNKEINIKNIEKSYTQEISTPAPDKYIIKLKSGGTFSFFYSPFQKNKELSSFNIKLQEVLGPN